MSETINKPLLNINRNGESIFSLLNRAQRVLRFAGAKEEYIASLTADILQSDETTLITVLKKYFKVDDDENSNWS